MIELILIITFVFGVFWHYILEKYWWASIGATLSSTVLFFIFALGMHYNFHSENVPEDVAKISIISLIFSMLIGAVFVSIRKKNVQQKT